MKASDAPADKLHRMRHSLAHVMALAVTELRPGTRLGFGPPIEDGFYYDFILPSPINEEDFPEIEKRMRDIIARGYDFSPEDVPSEAALARLDEMQEPYKREYALELLEREKLSALRFYRSGPFLDMCEGPHVDNTRQLPAAGFKLRNVAGAYWRGDARNVMMTRIYAWAFASKEELEQRVREHEEALTRDHKKLGRELELFAFDDLVGKGMPLWLPRGTVIRDELEKFARELEFEAGYQRVATPHLARSELYYKTGHLPYYAPHMFPFMKVKESDESAAEESYCLKPMNCPHHHLIFAARKRSYRELPMRLAEYGQVYRYEDSGALSGLLRVRAMSMNDAHIYCAPEQIESEFKAVIDMHRRVYDVLGLSNYYIRFSTRDPNDAAGKQKYVDNDAAWEETERIVKKVADDSGIKVVLGVGEAAFYGPKLDFQFRTVTGREETASTVQLDFAIPPRLGLTYVGADNAEHTPYVIHRAPLGTHERFVALLIEHFAGAFPTWLAPVQVRVVPVSEKLNEYGARVVAELRAKMIRAELDDGPDTFNKKLRNAMTDKVPNVAIVGAREQTAGHVTWRRYKVEEQRSLSIDEFRGAILDAIGARTRKP